MTASPLIGVLVLLSQGMFDKLPFPAHKALTSILGTSAPEVTVSLLYVMVEIQTSPALISDNIAGIDL